MTSVSVYKSINTILNITMATATTTDPDEKRVLDYMRNANRPYSVNDVFTNLHKTVGKTAVQRALDSLVAAGHVNEKSYGKQKVYVVKQPSGEDASATIPSEAEQRDLETRAQTAERELAAEQAEIKRLQRELNLIRQRPTCEQLRAKLADLQSQLAPKTQRLAAIDSADEQSRKVTPETMSSVKKIRTELVSEWRKRKRSCVDLIDCVLEGYPASKKAFFEEVGLETDEEHQAVIPSC